MPEEQPIIDDPTPAIMVPPPALENHLALSPEDVDRVAYAVMRAFHPADSGDATPYLDKAKEFVAMYNEINAILHDRSMHGDQKVTIDAPVDITPAPPPPDHVVQGVTIKPPA